MRSNPMGDARTLPGGLFSGQGLCFTEGRLLPFDLTFFRGRDDGLFSLA